ncbi:MAG: hypothetical protein KDA87_13265 [Planctomycetales bacterium]|nr:hypothetical protein [Planctomycetales bacterium]
MNEVRTQTRPPSVQADGRPTESHAGEVTTHQCLVVSFSHDLREMISNAANDTGWDTVVCSDIQNALAAFRRTNFQIGFVDLNSDTNSDELRQLCQQLVTEEKFLLAVCGHENDCSEEIWARQLGVWLYLPGVELEHAADIGALCEQAHVILAAEAQR